MSRPALALLVAMLDAASAADTLQVRYPRQDSSEVYPVKVLALALGKSGAPFNLAPLDYGMTQSRSLKQLAEGRDLNVAWSITSAERERDLLPVRIPIDKGLYGWRIFLVNRQDLPAFKKVKALGDLKPLKAGQGHDWPDTAILRANGLTVEAGSQYEGLFGMLKAQRFDYFPRSVLEIWAEAARHADAGLVVEPSVLLQYPTALYFFVAKSDPALATTLERGLNAAIQDGSFEQLFQQAYGEAIKRANLAGRTRLKLVNPLLPPTLPLQRKGLWQQ